MLRWHGAVPVVDAAHHVVEKAQHRDVPVRRGRGAPASPIVAETGQQEVGEQAMPQFRHFGRPLPLVAGREDDVRLPALLRQRGHERLLRRHAAGVYQHESTLGVGLSQDVEERLDA